MNLFRSVVFALSVAVIFSIGSSATATTHSRPQFATEGHTLDLRETGSKIVMETIEDALRQGGVALLGDGFQIDSSLGWVFGEDIESIDGGIDAAIPLLSKNGHIVFTQPGLVFWEGNGEEERIDANFGIVYRTDLANTPIGIDAIGGVSLFYDYDFHRVGHERLSIGADIQTDNFHGAFNYYHPLSNEEDGREGFIEDPLKGVDLRIALERSVVRAGARVGLWRFDGGEYVSDDWRVSVGGDVGLRIFPGVFIEGDWEKHQEDFIVDQRFKLGLAFRFSLPGFEGRSYAGGSKSTDLYKVVDREKRILYEERDSSPPVPTIWLTAQRTEAQEGATVTLTVRSFPPPPEDLVINLIGGGGTATYGEDRDWVLDNGNGNCSAVTGTSCQVTLPANGRDVSATITFNTDSVAEGEETFTIEMQLASESLATDVVLGDTQSLEFTIGYPGGTIGLGRANSAEACMTVNGTQPPEPCILAEEGDGMDAMVQGIELAASDPAALAAILDEDITLMASIVSENQNTDIISNARIDAVIVTQPVIDANTGMINFEVAVVSDGSFEGAETAVLTLPLDVNNALLPSGWSIDPDNNTLTIMIPESNNPN